MERKYRTFLNETDCIKFIRRVDGSQGGIKAGADGAAAPGPQSQTGPSLFYVNEVIKELK